MDGQKYFHSLPVGSPVPVVFFSISLSLSLFVCNPSCLRMILPQLMMAATDRCCCWCCILHDPGMFLPVQAGPSKRKVHQYAFTIRHQSIVPPARKGGRAHIPSTRWTIRTALGMLQPREICQCGLILQLLFSRSLCSAKKDENEDKKAQAHRTGEYALFLVSFFPSPFALIVASLSSAFSPH